MTPEEKKLALAIAAVSVGALKANGQTVPPATKDEENKLIAVLKSKAPRKEMTDACRQLSVIGTKDAVPVLAALLADEEHNHMARYALEPIADAAVDGALRDALGKLKGRPLVGVIGSLGVRKDVQAVGPLTRLLQETDPDVVKVTARSLGRIATAEAAKALQARLGTAPAALRPFVADGCMACAERLLAQGKKSEAAALYALVAKADLLPHVRLGAEQGAALAR